MPNDTVPAATTGLPICSILAEPIRGLANRPRLRRSTFDAAEQARAMNAMLAELSVILTGGANV